MMQDGMGKNHTKRTGFLADGRLQQIRIAVQGLGLILAVLGVMSGVPAVTTVLIAVSFLMGPVLCGWVCPYGFLQDLMARLGRMLGITRRRMPKPVARILASGRYVLLALFLLVSADFLFTLFSFDPRANLSLVLGGQAVTLAGWIVMGLFLVASLVYDRPFCNHLCIEGAKHGLFGLLRPVTIQRDAETCIGCGKCDRVCPMAVRVSDVDQVRSPQCINCMTCVSACPRAGTLRLAPVRTSRRLGRAALPVTALAACVCFLYVAMNGNEITLPFLEPITISAAAADTVIGSSQNAAYGDEAEPVQATVNPTPAVSGSAAAESESAPAALESAPATMETTPAATETTTAATDAAPTTEAAPATIEDTPAATEAIPAAAPTGDATGIPDGIYSGSGQGYRGTTTVEVTVRDETITNIEVVSTNDDARWFQRAYNTIVEAILGQQSAEVDSISGATYSSVAIKKAVADALTNAGGTQVSAVADVPAGTTRRGRH